MACLTEQGIALLDHTVFVCGLRQCNRALSGALHQFVIFDPVILNWLNY